MNKPQRITLSRKKGWKMPPNTVKVARPSKWGNPFKIGAPHLFGGVHDRESAIAQHKVFCDNPDVSARIKMELRGKNLACYCRQDQECHADTLLKIANKP